MVYITSRRDSVRSQAATSVKVYSNRGNVSLEVNGKTIGTPFQTQPHVFLWKDIELTAGENRIHVDAEGGVTDDCLWTYTDPKPPSP